MAKTVKEQVLKLMPKHRREDGSYNTSTIAKVIGCHRSSVQFHLKKALTDEGVRSGEEFPKLEHKIQPEAWIRGPAVEIVSRKNNTFCFAAIGDLHAGSKYCRWDVREDIIRRAENRGAQAICDTGNWIDGEANFNRYDLVAVGMNSQCSLLAEKHPKTKLPIYAVAGADHEGWYAKREGVDIGRYCEMIMRGAGHNWHNMGYMEAHVKLTNANSGKSAILAITHPGGGSAYALSYRPQKIIESLESGEKPAVLLLGHYHKIDAGIVRNVWYVQTGCCFTANTRVETSEGPKRINQVKVGDSVLTHKGRYRLVTKLFRRKFDGELVSINYGRKGRFDQTVTGTEEHPILVEAEDGTRVWTRFEDVKEGDTVFVIGKDCPVSGERIPFYMNLSKYANPMDKEGARKAASDAARLRPDYAGGRLKRSDVGDVHFLKDILPFCEIMREDGWTIVPVGNSVTPDAIGFKDGKVVAFELESAGGALLQFKKKKYEGALITKFVDDVRWVDLTPRVEQPRSWYEPDSETGFVRVKVLSVSRSPISGAHDRKSVTVYNFEVDEDNSYVAGHTVVHNCQDQTPFMRQKSLEAHVGGVIVGLEQDPRTGAILAMEPYMVRYFNRAYGDISRRWSAHGPVEHPSRSR